MLETEFCVVLTTTGSRDEAERLAQGLVSRKLAACVQVIAISSFFVWEGEAQNEPEFLLLIKSRRTVFSEIETFIISNHSYEVPEILQLPVVSGSGAYLNWVRVNTGS
jgi:periplasmic divalent cation tolerance protein